MASKEIALLECDEPDCDEAEFGDDDDLAALIRVCTERGWFISEQGDFCPYHNPIPA